MFVHVSPTLSPATLVRAVTARPSPAPRHVTYFGYARGALLAALHSIRAAKGLAGMPAVWLPAFICDTVPVALEAQGIPYHFYSVTDDLTPDWPQLAAARPARDDFFVLVHFFGFAMAAAESVEFCRSRGLTLIEDCAHSAMDEPRPGDIGTNGTAAIFGLRKLLPVPNGGALYMNDLPLVLPDGAPPASSIYRGVTKMLIQWSLQKSGLPWPGARAAVHKMSAPDVSGNHYFFRYCEGMTVWSRRIADAIDLDQVRRLRRRNFQCLLAGLADVPGVAIPRTLNLSDDRTVPWVFFFCHRNSEALINALVRRGISASYFPTLPKDVLGNPRWKAANDLFRRSITLPVHQDMTSRHLDRIIAIVRSH